MSSFGVDCCEMLKGDHVYIDPKGSPVKRHPCRAPMVAELPNLCAVAASGIVLRWDTRHHVQ